LVILELDWTVDVNVLRNVGVPERVLSGTVGTKMDDVLAAECLAGPILVGAGIVMGDG
jgi:hypothetical protein